MPTSPYLDVRIRFGNDAMLTPGDAADALEKIVHQLRQNPDVDLTKRDPEVFQGIRDVNGNTVGRWSLCRKPDQED